MAITSSIVTKSLHGEQIHIPRALLAKPAYWLVETALLSENGHDICGSLVRYDFPRSLIASPFRKTTALNTGSLAGRQNEEELGPQHHCLSYCSIVMPQVIWSSAWREKDVLPASFPVVTRGF